MRPVEFAGLSRLLGVSLMEEVNPDAENIKEKYAPRQFADVLQDVMDKFEKLNRSRKREIIKLIRKSNSVRGGFDASNSENTKDVAGNEEV